LRNLIESACTEPDSFTIKRVKYSRQKSSMLVQCFVNVCLRETYWCFMKLINFERSHATAIMYWLHSDGLASLEGIAWALLIFVERSVRSALESLPFKVPSDKHFYNFTNSEKSFESSAIDWTFSVL
jgi:hypothetical protein